MRKKAMTKREKIRAVKLFYAGSSFVEVASIMGLKSSKEVEDAVRWAMGTDPKWYGKNRPKVIYILKDGRTVIT